MSLRYQINLRVFFAALSVLCLGSSIAVWQARTAVNKEVESSINLAVQLINFSFAELPAASLNESDWLAKFQTLKATRHLNIQLQRPTGDVVTLGQKNPAASQDDRPPQWFINLVGGQYTAVEHNLVGTDNQPLKVIIQANPLDEITEVWEESLGFLISLVLLTSFTFLAVHLVFAKALQAIAIIVDALKAVETGNYLQTLPEFSTQEYASIAKAINHMTDELKKSHEQNRALTQHSLQIQEDERQRLSQELHDELGQSLTAIKVMAVTAAHAKADIQHTTAQIVAVCDHLMTVVRSMMQQLHPLILSELGLKAALEDLLQHWSVRHPELSVSLDCPDSVDNLDIKISIQIFRVAQECLTNIVRHAHAKHARIRLTLTPEQPTTPHASLTLSVADDGIGFVDEPLKKGFGLLGMRERIQSLGGELTILTPAQTGMQILASIPL